MSRWKMVVVTTSTINAPAAVTPIQSSAKGRSSARPSAMEPRPVTTAPTMSGAARPRRSTSPPAAIAPSSPPMPMAALR